MDADAYNINSTSGYFYANLIGRFRRRDASVFENYEADGKTTEKAAGGREKTDATRDIWPQQSHESRSEGENGLADRVGESRMMGDATGSDASLMQTMLRGILQETSTHLIGEQKKMLERLWDALMGNQQTATPMTGEQLEMIRQLQQEIQAVKTQAAEELKRSDELRRLHEQSTG
ncbi:hypothetical protein FOTG_17427 [Fusarium oxysporum f. sp. vasinfectum 25433]|uniref:Uncharacterized protein n=1 Tax=Fusarium oxysporum f. sp. vasinfectum 25433 TaxID=1089449 RepID=X0KKS4_FUSOX|nr:hypothetical protein FOTG_17427 [Fusarium oxysporum f. sp. vasinfectum 25433]